VDPGKRTLDLSRGKHHATQLVTLAEGELKHVAIRLARVIPPPKVPAPLAAPVLRKAEPPSGPPLRRGHLQRTLGWVALGVGAAGLVVFGVTGALALDKKGWLADRCADRSCPASLEKDVNRYNAYRVTSSVGFGVGIAGAAAGLVLILTAPKDRAGRERARVMPRIGLSGAGLGGRF